MNISASPNYNIHKNLIIPDNYINMIDSRYELDSEYAKRIQFYQSWFREVKDSCQNLKEHYRLEGRLTESFSIEYLNLLGISKLAGQLYDSIDEPTEEEDKIFEAIEKIVDDGSVLFKEINPPIDKLE